MSIILSSDASDVFTLKFVLILIGIFVGGLILAVGGAYVTLRILAAKFNGRRDDWQSSAIDLGFDITDDGGLLKTFTGTFDGRHFEVSYFKIVLDEDTVNDYASVETKVNARYSYSFIFKKMEAALKRAINYFSEGDTGHAVFDKVFETTTPSPVAVNELLNRVLPGGETPTLLTDLLLAAKRFHRVIVTDVSVTLGVRADLGDSDSIKKAMERASYLAKRLEAGADLK